MSPEDVPDRSVAVNQPHERTETDRASSRQDGPVISAPSRNEPDFNIGQIGSFIQNIKGQYDEYNNDSAIQDDQKRNGEPDHDPFADELRNYDGRVQDPVVEEHGKQYDPYGHDPFVDEIKDDYDANRAPVTNDISKQYERHDRESIKTDARESGGKSDHGPHHQSMKDSYEEYSDGVSTSPLSTGSEVGR